MKRPRKQRPGNDDDDSDNDRFHGYPLSGYKASNLINEKSQAISKKGKRSYLKQGPCPGAGFMPSHRHGSDAGHTDKAKQHDAESLEGCVVSA
jgi:hypothetical protein